MQLISRWRMLLHPARVRLFVVASALAFGFLLVAVVSLRVRDSQAELRGVEGAGPRILWAYASHVDLPSRLAALETVRAMAPGDGMGFVAASMESEPLVILGRGDLAGRVEAHTLDRRPWPRFARVLVLQHLTRLADEGREDEERVLATRAAEELPQGAPYFIESAVILLVRAGDPDRAIRVFERLDPKAVAHRETLLALASAHRALGDIETAARLAAESAKAPSHPMLVRPRPRVVPSPSANTRLANPLSHYADLVAPERPTAHWKTLLLANLRMALAYLGFPLALGLLAWMPASRPPSALRSCVGALTLAAAGAVSHPALGLHSGRLCGWFLDQVLIARPWSVGGAWIFWSMMLLNFFVILFALTLVERRNLLELGWRGGGVRLRHLLLAILLGVAWAAPIHLARAVAVPRTWRPSLLLGSALVSLYAASVEETIFRGYLMPALQRLPLAFPLANAIQAALFMAMHLLGRYPEPQPLRLVIFWCLLGLVCGWSVRRTGSLWPAFIGHAVYDLFYLYVVNLPDYEFVELLVRLS